MANIGWVFGVLKQNGVDTKGMTAEEAFDELEKLRQEERESFKQESLSNEQNTLKKEESNRQKLDRDIEAILNGKYKDSHITLCEETPKILQEIGIPNKPFLMTTKHAYLTINGSGKYNSGNDHYHDLGKEIFLDIPSLLKSPIMVFKNHNTDNEIIAVVNAVDKNKKPVILPIKINGSGKQNFIQVEANIVKSAYGKNNLQSYIDKNVKKEDILLIENKKIRNLNSD